MPEVTRRPLSAVTAREDQARTDKPRPQWQGLFVEPEWPPADEDDEG